MSTQRDSSRRDVAANDRRTAHVAIVGGGIAGLSAAWYLQQEAARQHLSVTYTVLERSDRWGGKILTEQIESGGGAPFILEAGPDALLTRKPWALALARELGLADRLLFTNQEHSHTFVLHHGRPVPLPEGTYLLVPTRLLPFLRSPLFSAWGKARIGLEPLIPPRRSAADESLADFVRRRLGAQALDKLAEPLMAGIYNAAPEQQSILATFPQLAAWEREHGSVMRGLRAATRKRAPETETTPPFFSFDTGTQTLVQALVTQLRGNLRLHANALRIERPAGGAFDVLLEDDRRLSADAVIVATPASAAATLLRAAAPDVAEALQSIRTASIGATYLGFRRADVPHPLDGFGVVIPSSERRRIDGMTWTSSKWRQRAPADHVLLRVYFGGPQTRDMMAPNDETLLPIIRSEVATMLGIHAPPLFHRTYRWPDGYPQYDVGHLERVDAIEIALPAGLYVAGSPYRGVGVPDCVRQGQTAALRVVESFGAPVQRT
jgi:protoporphyrinogen/coproporphyrinogen III oxidase